MDQTIVKYLFVLLLIFGISCQEGQKKYDNIVVERPKPVGKILMNRSYSNAKFEYTGPIAIKDFRAKLTLIGGKNAKMIQIKVKDKFLGDSTFYPIVRHGRNQILITGNPKQQDQIPEWEITLPDSFEIRIESKEGGIIASDLLGILTIQNQVGDLSFSNCSGVFEINNQEGALRMENTGFLGRSLINSRMGDISISLGQDLEYEVAVNSGSGSVDFAIGIHSILGLVKIIGKKGLGALSSYREPDSVGVFISSGLEIEYELMGFYFGANSPEITLSSGTGRVNFLKSLRISDNINSSLSDTIKCK